MEFLTLVLIAAAVWWFLRRRRRTSPQRKSTTRPPAPQATPPSRRRPAYTRERSAPTATPSLRFAEPGRRGPLFTYGGPSGTGYTHDGPFAVIDVETTGFSPAKGDRVIEIAVARVTADGKVEDEYATLINPEGRDTGATWVHGISNDAVEHAPLFGDVAGDILARLEGTVVVAHHAVFEERFLAAELTRAGVPLRSMPALCSLWLGQRTFDTPNHKLATLAREAGIPFTDAHAALGDVRAVGRLLPLMLDRHGSPLVYGCAPGTDLCGGRPVGRVAPVTRAAQLRKGTDGWMASLMSRLPMQTGELTDAAAAAYLEVLSDALEDGRIIGDEAKVLARLAGSYGMGAAEVAALNEQFLESMRQAAFADEVLTAAELRDLTRASRALGVPDYFDDLTPTPSLATTTATATKAPRRCGHCRTPGHTRTTCPELN